MSYMNTADARAVCQAIEAALQADDVNVEGMEVDRDDLDSSLKEIVEQINDDETFLADNGCKLPDVEEALDDLRTMVKRIVEGNEGEVHPKEDELQLYLNGATEPSYAGSLLDRIVSELELQGFRLVRI